MKNRTNENNIFGDFSECGCWKGHSTYMTSKLLQDSGFIQTFHVFDSFEGGLSNKNKEDENLRVKLTKEQIKKEKMIFSNSEEEVRDLLLVQ
jgi:O-methyltransferase